MIIAGVQGIQYTSVLDCASSRFAVRYGPIPNFWEIGFAKEAPTARIAGAFRPIMADRPITIREITTSGRRRPSSDTADYAKQLPVAVAGPHDRGGAEEQQGQHTDLDHTAQTGIQYASHRAVQSLTDTEKRAGMDAWATSICTISIRPAATATAPGRHDADAGGDDNISRPGRYDDRQDNREEHK